MGVNVILAVLVVSFSCINAQEFAIFDQSDFNIWDAEEEGAFLEVDQTVASLCQNYNLVLNNKEIDCATLQLVPKVPEEPNNHVIQKRSIDEAELEGSGNGEIEKPASNFKAETDVADSTPSENKTLVKTQKQSEPANIQVSNIAKNTQVAPTATETKPEQPAGDIKTAETIENKTESLPTTETKVNANKNLEKTLVPSLETTSTTLEADPTKPNTTMTSQTVTTHSPVVAAANNESPKLEDKEGSINGSDSTIIKEVVQAPTEGAPQSPVTTVLITEAPKVLEKKEGNSDNTADAENKEFNQEATTKASPKMLPSDLAEVEYTGKQKEVETVNEQQSGNVVLLKHPEVFTNDKSSSVEGSESDKAIQRMAEKAKISNETDQPSTGESAKNVNRASKDTTILIVLFVIVIAIGGAAFTHNFIKKRKQKNKNNEVVNGIRRSLQNLTAGNGKNTNDIEQGTELKPLMKENSPTITKQFTDVKTEVEK